jgi:hypothetical protein
MLRKRNYHTAAILKRIAETFDETWYVTTYARDLAAHKNPDETPLDFYLRLGARIGHDPHRRFSELYFRTVNPRVYKRLLKAPRDFGYLLFIGGFGAGLFKELRVATPPQCENWRVLTTAIDRQFLAARYSIDFSSFISELDFYIRCSRTRPISPSASFSEERYRDAQIEKDIREDRLISGYHQFVVAQAENEKVIAGVPELQRPSEGAIPDSAEMIRRLEETIPGSTRPIELGLIRELEYLTAPITVNRGAQGGHGFLVFIAYFIPELFFGGYAGFFELLKNLKAVGGGDLKLVIVRKMPSGDDLRVNIERIRQSAPDIASLFSSFHLLQEDRTFDVDGDYGVISFCAETHFVASDAARQLNVTPYFYLPDYEPDFNSAGSLKTFVRSAYDLPHRGLYNSRKLYEYFKDFVRVEQVQDPNYRYVTFENAIKPMPWDRQTFHERHSSKGKKRLIIYARPEPVGSRNDFALIVLALKKALREGHFDESSWSFHGIGAMAPFSPVELTPQSHMEVIPKLPLQEYEEFLLQGDIGISVISTPHPGIIHFQMAAFGLASITYAMDGRSPQWLRSQSKNLIPCHASIDGLCHGIAQAVQHSADIGARYDNALRTTVAPTSTELEAAARFCLSR